MHVRTVPGHANAESHCSTHKVVLYPMQECNSNENTVLAVTPRGGHVAFLQGLWPFGTAWMDQVAIQFLTMCSNVSQNQFDATQGNAVSS